MRPNELSVDTPPAALTTTSRRSCLFEEFIVILGVVSIWRAGLLAPAPAMPQDTTKQTGAFSLPLFLYIYSGRGVAIVLSIAAQFTCDCGRDSRPRVLSVMFMVCARLSSHHALIVDKHIPIIPASKMQRLLPVKKCQDPSHASKMQRLSPAKTRR